MTYLGLKMGAEVLECGVAAASGALAALAVNSPIGPAGGALGASLGWLVGKPVQYLTTSLFNTDSPTASLISRIVQLAVSFMANAALFMFSSSWIGIPISFKASCILAGATVGISLGVLVLFGVAAYMGLKAVEA